MNSNKITISLCVVLAIITAVFAALTVADKLGSKEETKIEKTAASYTIEGVVEYDAAAAGINSIVSNDVKTQKSYPEGILEKFKQVYAVNNDLVGWLSIPGTELDTAIVQSNDNSYYLSKNFYKQSTSATTGYNYGNLYLDYRCRNDGVLSKNMIIYGHTTGKSDNVPKQSFRSLYDYRDKNHFIKNPIVKYSTLYGDYTYKICAVFYSTTEKKSDNGYMFNYIYPDMSDNNMIGYIEQVKQRMLYETGVSLEPTDNIITLSTCIYDFGKSVDTRLVVVARLLHEGEGEEIDTSLVKDNPDYRRPQVWYNSKGKTNPYKNSAKWEPSPN